MIESAPPSLASALREKGTLDALFATTAPNNPLLQDHIAPDQAIQAIWRIADEHLQSANQQIGGK